MMDYPDLEKYADKYYESEFVPFPTPEDAAQMVIETTSYLFCNDGLSFVKSVVKELQEWIDYEENGSFD